MGHTGRGTVQNEQGGFVAQHLDGRALSGDASMSVRDSIRIVSPGHAAFAVVLIALGITGFVTREFSQMWQPVPK